MRILLPLVLLASAPALAEEPVCRTSSDCKEGTACDEGKCVPLSPRIILPPIYYRSADRQVTMITPLFWRRKPNAEGRATVLFPLYWHFDDRTLHVKNTVVPPFHWRSAIGEANTRIYPLFFYTDYAKRGWSMTLLPLMHASKVDGKALGIFPLGFWRKDYGTGATQGLVLPYYFRRGADGKRTDAFFPLFFSRSSKEHAFEYMVPLNFYWRTKERRSLLLLPLVFHRSDVRERVLFTLVPPMVYTRHDPPPPSALGRPRGVEHRFFTLFPVFWYQRSGRSTFALLPPIFHRGHPDGHHSGIFPLLWFGRDKQSRHTVLFPIYWHFSGKKSGFTLAALLAYHRRHETGHSSGVVPIAFFGEDRRAGSSYKLILPLFYRGTERHGRQSTTVVLPLLWWTRDDDAGLRRQVLALNYYHRRDRARSIDAFIPLFLRWKNADTGASTWVVPPFVHHDSPESSTTVLFPLYVGFADKREAASGGLALGIFYWNRGPQKSTHVLFPLVFSSRRGGERTLVGFPLVWHFSSERNKTRTTIIGPFYSVRDREGTSWGLAPILLTGDNAGVSHQIVLPIFAHLRDRKEGWNVWVFGPAFHVGTRAGWTAGVFPLAWFGSGADGRSTAVIPPLLFARLREPRSETIWVGPWLDSHEWDEQRQQRRFRMVFPLYFHTVGPTRYGQRETHTLVPFFHRSRDPAGEWLVTPVGGFHKNHAARSETGMWGLYGWRRSPTVNLRAVLPFWIQSTDTRDRSRTTVVFPFWVGFRAPGRAADVVFPLVWRFQEPDENDLVVFPLYFRVRRPDHTDDVDVIFPMVWSFRSPKRSIWVVPPVYWKNGPDGGGAFGLVPLVFSAHSRQRSYLVVFPLIWQFDNKVERRVRRFYGLFYNHQDATGFSIGLFPLVFFNRHQNSDHSVIFPVFWQFVDRKADTRTTFVTLLFHRRKAAYTTVGIAPLAWTTWDKAGGFSLTLLPLFHYRSRVGNFRLWTIPFGYCNDGTKRQGWFIPYYGSSDPNRTVQWAMPLFLRWHDRALQRTTWIVPPLLGYSRSDPFTRTDTALLVFWHVKRIDGRSTVLFPLYWDFHDYEERRSTVVFPVFWRFADRTTRRTTWIVPPLLLGGTSHPHGNDVTWFPLLWRAQRKHDGYTVFFPLYWNFWQGKTSTTVVVPFGFHADRAATETWLVLNTFVRLYKKTDGYQVMFIPLFEWARERPTDLRWEVVLGLVGYERVGPQRYLKVLWIPFRMQSPAPGRMAWFESDRRQAAWVR